MLHPTSVAQYGDHSEFLVNAQILVGSVPRYPHSSNSCKLSQAHSGKRSSTVKKRVEEYSTKKYEIRTTISLTKLSKYLVSAGLIRDISSKRFGVFERYAIILLPAIGNKFAAKCSISVTAVVT